MNEKNTRLFRKIEQAKIRILKRDSSILLGKGQKMNLVNDQRSFYGNGKQKDQDALS